MCDCPPPEEHDLCFEFPQLCDENQGGDETIEEFQQPGDNSGGGGGGGANSGTPSVEFDPNITNNDPDIFWWNDNTTAYPPQTLPTWNNMFANYPKDANGNDMPAPQVYSLVGGQVLSMYNSNPNAYANACALRVSRALNYSSVTIPNITNHTFQGSDGKYYFLSSAQFGALGHTTLFDGNPCIGNHCYFDAPGGVEKIVLWKLQ